MMADGGLLTGTTLVLPYEVLDVLRQGLAIDIRAGLDFTSNFCGNVL